MIAPGIKYAADTNLFIEAFRDPLANDALAAFHHTFAPFEYLSAIVAHELRTGARTVARRRALSRHVIEPFERRGRMFAPSIGAWQLAGDAAGKLAAKGTEISRSFGLDLLLAASCGEAGVTLLTRNVEDFKRIRRVVPFSYQEPWPTLRRT